MSDFPSNLRYTQDHEWALIDGSIVCIGITQHAVDKLGDIVLVNLDVKAGSELTAGKAFGTVESTKAVSDLFSPVTGTVTEVNKLLADAPETVNTDPYGAAWMIKVRTSAVPTDLLDAAAYAKHCAADH